MMLEEETGSKYTFESGLFYFKTGFPVLFFSFAYSFPLSFSKNIIHPSKHTLTYYYIALHRIKDEYPFANFLGEERTSCLTLPLNFGSIRNSLYLCKFNRIRIFKTNHNIK